MDSAVQSIRRGVPQGAAAWLADHLVESTRHSAIGAAQVGNMKASRPVIRAAQLSGASRLPVMRQRIMDSWIGLRLLRYNALRAMSGLSAGRTPGPEASVSKLQWGSWHRSMANLGMDVQGAGSLVDDHATRLFLFSRADTIYGGSNQIQRNVIRERVLGLPKQPAP